MDNGIGARLFNLTNIENILFFECEILYILNTETKLLVIIKWPLFFVSHLLKTLVYRPYLRQILSVINYNWQFLNVNQ